MSDNVLQRLDSLQRIGIKLGLRNIKSLLEVLGNPEKAYPSVLIAGTNGKGSTGAMLDEMLRKQGLFTGHYTSPHLLDVRERIRIGGKIIGEAEMDAALQSVFDAADTCISKSALDAPPTYFETLTAAALYAFRGAGVEFAVIEVGLGGRFDATNVVQQTLSVITNVDYDHQEYLGHSLAEIAGEKAGILKPGIPLVTGVLHAEADRVVCEAAVAQNCGMLSLQPQMIENLRLEEGRPIFGFQPWQSEIQVNLRGAHQATNASVALLAAEALSRTGIEFDRQTAIEALRTVQWPGRLDLIEEHPVPVLVDSAHNPGGVESLARFLKDTGWPRVIVLFSAMRDKNIATMLSRIAPFADTVFLTRIEPRDRCARFEELGGACMTHHLPFTFKDDCATAFQLAREDAAAKGLPVVVFGSIYLIGEIFRITGRSV